MESNRDHNNAYHNINNSQSSADAGSASITHNHNHIADNPIVNTQHATDAIMTAPLTTLQNMPKSILHENTMTMRLRLNFPSADGNSFTEDLTDRDLHADILNNVDSRQPERKNSKLLTEGLLRAMRTPAPVAYETSAADECDDTFPDNLNPWMLESERRDSVETTRKKLTAKMSGATRSKNQRNRRGLRESRRSTGVAVFDEMKNPLYQNDDEGIAQETRKNTIQNERPYHQLMQQNQNPFLPGRKNFDQPVFEHAQRISEPENASSEESSSGIEIPIERIFDQQTSNNETGPNANDLYAQLETELDALIKGLQMTPKE
ncbi:uncharacterized protein LOC129584679 [Paramacrobiotus metropolitanus]|uniref:uncharacterized protein LOC129584679 n=1 Tax=Paramacrobiotus metropolitanus TaxID=2943436 RepID=UPI0024462AEE|nr:uncharacterized protein LOC129584679 [Paramacrobiotus metropolitanus]XP_055332951.1 uncharacterized protein LOC129584679 [Paramacrobiotus metropolitanus]XP_055332958.1 uncharacterized protein LOC129584679 [Paramacrobiotus metropolitanus]XP_055332967.1 uncharacterized protein LOC129584679 [Paramacrobiotus metropolitanus]